MAKPNLPAKNSVAPVAEAPVPANGNGTGKKRGRRPGAGPVKKIEFVPTPGAAYIDASGKFTSMPTEFDRKKHKPLSRKQFADEALFLNLQADEFERRAKRLRKQADDVKALGGLKDKAKAKKLLTLQAKMAALRASILADDPSMLEMLNKMGEINAQKAEENGEAVAEGAPVVSA